MSKRLNENFLKSFLELDRLCCEKFGVATGGVTEYINRLNNARFAPDRDTVLPKLVKYRNIRNLFAHEPGAIRKSDEVTKEDLNWLLHFRRDVIKKRDTKNLKSEAKSYSVATDRASNSMICTLPGSL